MAVPSFPSFTKDATQTDGTGTITLEGSTAAGYQTPDQAVTRGTLADGATVGYVISDRTANPLDYEVGVGVYDQGTNSLTRPSGNVVESSNSGNLVSWPSGGTRDVTIVFHPSEALLSDNNLSDLASASTARTNLDVPGLSTANTFSAAQTIQSPNQPQLLVDEGSGGGQTQFRLKNTGLAQEWALRMVINSNLKFRDITGGSDVLELKTDGTLLDGSGNKYDAFPSGTKMLFATAPPVGWTRSNEASSRVIRLATSGDTIGSTGGTDDIFDGSWKTEGHILTESQIPSHNHPHNDAFTEDNFVMFINTGGSAGDLNSFGSGTNSFQGSSVTGDTGGGSSHSHNMSTPLYTIACWATKD